MGNFMKTFLLGRLGTDPDFRYTPDGTPVCTFTMAVNDIISKEVSPECPKGWKESFNGKSWEVTYWYRVTTWRRLAENVNTYLHKGNDVFVEGQMTGEAKDGTVNARAWADKNTGEPRASFEITSRNVQFIGKGDGNGGRPFPDEPPGSTQTETPF